MTRSKTQVPPPPRPRRQAGPKRRDTQPPQWRKRAFIAGAAALVLGAVIAAVVVVSDGGGEKALAEKLVAAGCTLKTYPEQEPRHVATYEAKVAYNSFPPTSGTHHQQPVVWGEYPEPVVAIQEPHNLEHGGVIIQYGDKVPAATRKRLQAFYADSPNGMVLAPLPKLGNRIALTAWTKLATCEQFDEKAFAAFRSAYRGKGPERFSVGDLKPGT